MSFLDEILERKKIELAGAKRARSLDDLKRMMRDTLPIRSFSAALANGFGMIAEIKKRSPSGGEMRPESVAAAPGLYANSSAVRAISVLTNGIDFGMSLEDLLRIKAAVSKPVLRKDFIFEEY